MRKEKFIQYISRIHNSLGYSLGRGVFEHRMITDSNRKVSRLLARVLLSVVAPERVTNENTNTDIR